jgi:lysophospholipid acyltransferase (LPLAT)-like uncharacterized protein
LRILRLLLGWTCAVLLLAMRATCRYRVENDPRPALRRARRPYTYALLHAHQVAAVFVNDEEDLAAMVSRSADGDILVPSLRVRGVRAVRGSSRTRSREKGGRAALAELGELVTRGVPVLFAVDGPQGPRNHVHRGVVDLARQTGATILPTLVLPSRRWILERTWDRFQIPKPFSEIRLIFGPPIEPAEQPSDEALLALVGSRLTALETEHDGAESALATRRSTT